MVTLEVLDGHGEGISGLTMDDIEVGIEPAPLWTTLTRINNNPEQPAILYFTDNGDGTYTYRAFRDEPPVVTVSLRAAGEVIESELEIEVTGMQKLSGQLHLPKKFQDVSGEFRVAVAMDDVIPPENVVTSRGGQWEAGTESVEYELSAPLGDVYILGVLFEGEPEPGEPPHGYTEPKEFEVVEGENIYDIGADYFDR